uniref:Zgc:110410 n=1 Tax=Amphilophus citrinellus TaxID=61819 RepID=A0A3Q0T4I3_AMPCI
MIKVGNGSVAVVSPPGTYENMAHPAVPGAAGDDQQGDHSPPVYSPGLEDSAFSDAVIRRGFVRKVYLTLMIQLLITVGIICAFLYWVVVLVFILALSCCDSLRRQVPLNFIALGLFVILTALFDISVCRYFEAEAVMWAVGATALVSFSLSLFAMQSKWDFTTASGCLWVFTWTLLSFALLCAILRSQYVYIVYACLGTLLFSLYMVFDTQLILGGKHRKYQVSPEEYVFAALNLYLDIVSLFLILLQFIGLCR